MEEALVASTEARETRVREAQRRGEEEECPRQEAVLGREEGRADVSRRQPRKYQGATRVSRNEEIEWRKRRLERGGQKPTGRGGGVEERRKVEEERWRR